MTFKARIKEGGMKPIKTDWKRALPVGFAFAALILFTVAAQNPAAPAQSGSTPDPDFARLPKVWHSETTKHDFRVEVNKDLFRAEWVNLPAESAKKGAFIHTECRRTGSKWIGKSNINMLVEIPGAPAGVETKLCQITIRFEVDSVSPEKITGQGESLHSFDAPTCRVNETRWAPFTWVPRK